MRALSLRHASTAESSCCGVEPRYPVTQLHNAILKHAAAAPHVRSMGADFCHRPIRWNTLFLSGTDAAVNFVQYLVRHPTHDIAASLISTRRLAEYPAPATLLSPGSVDTVTV